MNEIEKQILKNQLLIMQKVGTDIEYEEEFISTRDLLSPKGADEDSCDMDDKEKEKKAKGVLGNEN